MVPANGLTDSYEDTRNHGMTTLRQKLNRSAGKFGLIFEIGEDNIGAINILKNITASKGDNQLLETLFDLDDMNIRGEQIWVGFTYHCERDLDVFIEKVRARDPAMVETINNIMGKEPSAPKAITFGASFLDTLPVWAPGEI